MNILDISQPEAPSLVGTYEHGASSIFITPTATYLAGYPGNMHIVDTARKAMEELGVEPIIKPIRGGTDGSRLSFMGLPTPNVFTGGHYGHGKYEFVPVHAMEKAVEVVLKIVELYSQK